MLFLSLLSVQLAVPAEAHAAIPLDRTNWTAKASHFNASDQVIKAIDQWPGSRWSSNKPQEANMWFELDLNAIESFNKIVIKTSYDPTDNPGKGGFLVKRLDHPRAFKVVLSDRRLSEGQWLDKRPAATGGTTITSEAVVLDPDAIDDTTTIDLESLRHARFVRIYLTAGANVAAEEHYWWSIRDIVLYDDVPSEAPAEPPSVCVEGTTDPGELNRADWGGVRASINTDDAAKAIDALGGTRWTTDQAQTGGMWFEIDLGSQQDFNRLVLETSYDLAPNPHKAGGIVQHLDHPRSYEVRVLGAAGTDSDWADAAVVAAGSGTPGTTTDIRLESTQTARYLRIYLTDAAAAEAQNHYWWSINDIKVLNTVVSCTAVAALEESVKSFLAIPKTRFAHEVEVPLGCSSGNMTPSLAYYLDISGLVSFIEVACEHPSQDDWSFTSFSRGKQRAAFSIYDGTDPSWHKRECGRSVPVGVRQDVWTFADPTFGFHSLGRLRLLCAEDTEAETGGEAMPCEQGEILSGLVAKWNDTDTFLMNEPDYPISRLPTFARVRPSCTAIETLPVDENVEVPLARTILIYNTPSRAVLLKITTPYIFDAQALLELQKLTQLAQRPSDFNEFMWSIYGEVDTTALEALRQDLASGDTSRLPTAVVLPDLDEADYTEHPVEGSYDVATELIWLPNPWETNTFDLSGFYIEGLGHWIDHRLHPDGTDTQGDEGELLRLTVQNNDTLDSEDVVQAWFRHSRVLTEDDGGVSTRSSKRQRRGPDYSEPEEPIDEEEVGESGPSAPSSGGKSPNQYANERAQDIVNNPQSGVEVRTRARPVTPVDRQNALQSNSELLVNIPADSAGNPRAIAFKFKVQGGADATIPNHGDLINHLDALGEQWETTLAKGDTGSSKPMVEVLGEVATSQHVLANNPTATLEFGARGKGSGKVQGIDQAWKVDMGAAGTKYIFAEAKGGGSPLSKNGEDRLFDQMRTDWVIDRLVDHANYAKTGTSLTPRETAAREIISDVQLKYQGYGYYYKGDPSAAWKLRGAKGSMGNYVYSGKGNANATLEKIAISERYGVAGASISEAIQPAKYGARASRSAPTAVVVARFRSSKVFAFLTVRWGPCIRCSTPNRSAIVSWLTRRSSPGRSRKFGSSTARILISASHSTSQGRTVSRSTRITSTVFEIVRARRLRVRWRWRLPMRRAVTGSSMRVSVFATRR